MNQISINLYGSLGLSVLVIIIGKFLHSHIYFFRKYSIPEPIIGGFLFSIINFLLRQLNICEISVDMTLRDVFMVGFFCTVGFLASFIKIKQSVKITVILSFLTLIIIFCQDIIGIVMAKFFNIDLRLGLCLGSMPLTGGHGVGGAFAPILEEVHGVKGAKAVTMASATFGLIAGGLIGGPIGISIIRKHNLKPKKEMNIKEFIFGKKEHKTLKDYKMINASMLIMFSLGISIILYSIINKIATIPLHFSAMLIGLLIRNLSDKKKIELPLDEIEVIGDICLQMFLGLIMIDLQLWQLISLAIPMISILLVQVLFMALFAYFVIFNTVGKDYDAALISAGVCGFGLGATPNAITNMSTIAKEKGMSTIPFLVVPIIGGIINDFINIILLSGFIEFLSK